MTETPTLAERLDLSKLDLRAARPVVEREIARLTAALAAAERERDEAVQKGAELLAASLKQTHAAVVERDSLRELLAQLKRNVPHSLHELEHATAADSLGAVMYFDSAESKAAFMQAITDMACDEGAARKRTEEGK